MRERMVDRFQALDPDGDGSVTGEEFVNPLGRMVARLDENDDGKLAAEEMRRPHHRGKKRR